MINFKKMDEKEFVFINKQLSDKEDKAFSDFLKNRKEKSTRSRIRVKLEKVTAK